MPRYKKNQKKYRKKYPRYRSMTQKNGPLSSKLKATFIYHDEFELDIGASGVPASYVFSANGCYDPNITGVGHQPRGFDQLMALYDHYTVIATKVTLTASNSDVGNGAIISLALKDNSTVFSSPNDILENRAIRYTSISPEGSGPNNKSISMRVAPTKYLGRTKALSEDNLRGSASSNPSEQLYIHCNAVPAPAGIDNGKIYARVRIEYVAILTEPKQPNES